MAPSPSTHPVRDSLRAAAGHHAHLVAGPAAESYELVCDFVADSLGLSCHGHPDTVTFDFDSIGVDEARSIAAAARIAPLAGGRRALIVRCSGLTREAQNALLKVIEEPAAGVAFFIIVPTLDAIIPTIRSRAAAHYVAGTDAFADEAMTFLAAPVPKRLAAAKAFATAVSDGERGRGDVLSFLASLEAAVRRADGTTLSAASAAALRDIVETKRYALDRSSSVKMLLERLALTVPRRSSADSPKTRTV